MLKKKKKKKKSKDKTTKQKSTSEKLNLGRHKEQRTVGQQASQAVKREHDVLIKHRWGEKRAGEQKK